MAEVASALSSSANATGLMAGPPPYPRDRLVTLGDWQLPPKNRWAFQHVRELVPSARIRSGDAPVWELPRDEQDVLGVPVQVDAGTLDVGQLLADSMTDGFLVLHHGRVVAEHYFNGMKPDTPHLLMSVSKSITAAVCGCLAHKGLLDVDAPLTDLVPELGGTAFAGATSRHLLDMRAGIRFDENYDNLDADVRVYEQVYLLRPRIDADLPTDALAYFATLRRDGAHGGSFRYSSILTDVLAWVLERAGGARFHELVARELWAPIGAEFDAEITLDAHGNPMADGGVSATLRDLGRFGLQYLTGGATARPIVVPEDWVRDTIRGAPDGPAVFQAAAEQPGFPLGSHYRNCWWVRDVGAPYLHASGIYGQNVFVHAPTQLVVVKFSTWTDPLDREALDSAAAAVIAIGEHLER